ncbi:MAG: M13 family metallopeptidase [Oceanospirillaceae bacterium]|nr:M13 family metallopeptidase [Oceanospirillaceae bacterium]
MRKSRLLTGTIGSFLLLTSVSALAEDSENRADPDKLAFSIENMDRSVDPADDFRRYASGGWFDRVERPADRPVYGFMQIMGDTISQQMASVLAEAAATSSSAAKGSPAQQVGALYNSYVDVDRIDGTGLAPIAGELARLEAVEGKEDLAAYLGAFSTRTGQWPFVNVSIFQHLSDVTRNAVYFEMGHRALTISAIYESPEDSTLRTIYRDYVTSMLEVAGVPSDRARGMAATSLAIDTLLHAGQLDPVKKVDRRNINNPRTIEELRAESADFAVGAYLQALGLQIPDRVILIDPDAASTLGKVMAAFTVDELKGYLKLRLIQSFGTVLTTKFEEPKKQVNIALLGAYAEKPREESVVEFIQKTLGQPLGRLYVQNFFSKPQVDAGLDMIRRIQAAFRKRIEANDWMAEETRSAALGKVDALYYRVGYPDRWIDYGEVEIGDDPVQNVINLREFEMARIAAKQDGPVEIWAFSDPLHTAPTVVNAAYDALINGFEVTAAIAQPPAFSVNRDAPLYFCRLGAIIGHEMTHGFDTGGRNFDAKGNLRNWWTARDEARFEAEAQKLIDQGNAFEVLPGTFMNGGLTVTENLADIGGITLAHDALMNYLEVHPDENVEIDGLSPSQRCFIAYSQLWAEQRSDGAMRVQLEDNHAPGIYRAVAPLQHLEAFYDAFDIEEGDPMWLPPEKRIDIW